MMEAQISPKQTNWIVFTGTSCAGKTTVLNAVAGRGYRIVPEASRTHYEAQRQKGLSEDEVRADEAAFQRAVLDQKLKIETHLDPQETVFLDRAIPDSISYYRNAGLDPEPIRPMCSRFRYKAVFIFDPLPLEDDPARTESPDERARLQDWLLYDYRTLGYAPVTVPMESVDDRLSIILRHFDGYHDPA